MSRSYGNKAIIFQCLRKLPSSAKQRSWVQKRYSRGEKPWPKPLAGGSTKIQYHPSLLQFTWKHSVDGWLWVMPADGARDSSVLPMKSQNLPRAMGIASTPVVRAARLTTQHQLLCSLCAEMLPECWHFNSMVPSLHMIRRGGITGCINVILDNNILLRVGFLAPYVPLRENSIPITPALALSLKAIHLGH